MKAASQKRMAEAGMSKLIGNKIVPLSSRECVPPGKSDDDLSDYDGDGAQGGIEPPTLRFSVACSTN